VHGHLGGLPPKVDLKRERLLGEVLLAGSRDGMVSAAHDLSDGGLAQALVEACLIGETGARVFLDSGQDAFTQLFSESAGRVLVAVPRSEELRFTDMCTARQLPWRKVGVVDPESDSLEIQDLGQLPLGELRAAWEGTLPALFD
jgi:phosphoribosylformylglycinamidine synthase